MPGLPGPVNDEREGLLAFLEQQRAGIRNALHGLTDEQARSKPTTTSELSLAGLLKHMTNGERGWIHTMTGSPDHLAARDWSDEFRIGDGETVAEWLAEYEQVARETEAAVANIDLSAPVPVPKGVPWFPDDVEAWSARWVLLHVIEETARHAGHADILREAIDGKTMYELMAEAEQWETVPW